MITESKAQELIHDIGQWMNNCLDTELSSREVKYRHKKWRKAIGALRNHDYNKVEQIHSEVMRD